MLLAVLVCDFEKDFCNWQDAGSDPNHKWLRRTGNEIADEPGPDADFQGNNEKYFLIATNNGKTDDVESSEADLRSPYLNSTEHPYECFSFWFQFGVSIDY